MAPDILTFMTLVVGALETNCYLVVDPGTGCCLIIDPGSQADRIAALVESGHYTPRGIVLTHGHMDHVGAVRDLQKRYSLPVMIHVEDAGVLASPLNLAFAASLDLPAAPTADRLLRDGDQIECGSGVLTVIHTPGHTPGSIVLVHGRLAFTGDTLFQGNVGRTDLPGGDFRKLQHSLERIGQLPPDTIVLPGHGDSSTVADELATNPYL
jgi:hydroxyacylglutathione hydrolase